jgi:hypothetical protein
MKYVTYLVFFLFVAALLYFLKSALEPREVPVVVNGSVKCGECHSLKINGNQQSVWESSRHSQAFKTLLTDKAREYTVKNNLPEPVKNEKCLKCHTTGGFLNTGIAVTYNIEEGVGCEACHGAGSDYSPAEIMKNEELFIKHGGEKGDAETCLECHSQKKNSEKILKDDSCPFQDEDFDFKSAFEKIKHPVNKENF